MVLTAIVWENPINIGDKLTINRKLIIPILQSLRYLQ